MKKTMKTFTIMLLLVSIVFTFTGCEKYINSGEIAKQVSEKIIQSLDNDDVEGLKSVLCERIRSNRQLDGQIKEAMDFFEGKTNSYGPILTGGGRSVDDGKTTLLDICPHIANIVTDTDKKYEILFYSYIVYAEHPEKEGVSEITIWNPDGDKYIIGSYIQAPRDY